MGFQKKTKVPQKCWEQASPGDEAVAEKLKSSQGRNGPCPLGRKMSMWTLA